MSCNNRGAATVAIRGIFGSGFQITLSVQPDVVMRASSRSALCWSCRVIGNSTSSVFYESLHAVEAHFSQANRVDKVLTLAILACIEKSSHASHTMQSHPTQCSHCSTQCSHCSTQCSHCSTQTPLLVLFAFFAGLSAAGMGWAVSAAGISATTMGCNARRHQSSVIE